MRENISLLLVEDSLAEQDLIKDILLNSTSGSYSVKTASRLAEALSFLEINNPDLVILDLGLPDSDGLHTLEKVIKIAPHLPVLVLTGQEDMETGQRAIQLGAQDFLTKGSGAELVLPRICFYTIERFRAQEQAKVAEVFMRKSLDSLATQIAIVNREGRIVLVNKAWREFYGVEPTPETEQREQDNYIDNFLKNSDSKDKAERIKENVHQVFAGEKPFYELEYSCDTGAEVRWFQVKVTPLLDGRSEYIVFAHHDITGRKEMEEALLQSRNFLRKVFDTSPNLVFVKDIRGQYVMANRALASVYGCSIQELLGRTDLEIMKMKGLNIAEGQSIEFYDRQVLAEMQTRVIEAEPVTDVFGITSWYRTIKTPMKTNGSEPLLLGISVDITQDLMNQKKVRTSERLLRTLLNALHLGIILLDENMRVIWANDKALKDSNFDGNEAIVGKFCRDVWHRNTMCPECPAKKALQTGEIITETIAQSPEQTLTMTGCPVPDETNKATQVVVISEDISDKLSLERQLRQAQKMESLGTLAGGIAHDFNNILTAILGFTELGIDKAESCSELTDDLQEVKKAGFRARDLVHQILTFSRQVEQELKPLDITIVIKEVLRLLKASLPTSIRIERNIPNNLGLVIADPTQIHQVVMNLCTNASHAIAESEGKITISLVKRLISVEELPQYHDLVPGPYLELRVSDTGKGIPSKDLPVIFDPYFTTKEAGEGTGLGLSVVHGIVKDCGGAIEVSSIVGKGTTFTILLPVYHGEQTELLVENGGGAMSGNGEKILVVDDEPPILIMCRKLLQKNGYVVHTEKDPREALSRIKQEEQPYNLLLSDVVMPYMTGDRLAVEARRIYPDLPVILMSGNITQVKKEVTQQRDMRLLDKPLDSSLLLKVLREFLDREKNVETSA